MYSKHDENIGDELTTLATRTEPQHNTKYKKHNFTVKTTMLLFKNIIIDCWAKLQDSLTQNFNSTHDYEHETYS